MGDVQLPVRQGSDLFIELLCALTKQTTSSFSFFFPFRFKLKLVQIAFCSW